jgi:CRISPR-associated endoribonuclease Cas6
MPCPYISTHTRHPTPQIMPYSLVLNLLPTSPIYPQYLTGRHFHALFLTLVTAVDKELGDTLHESSSDKAFTLSPLQVSNAAKYEGYVHGLQWQQSRPIPPVTPCWWRISLLDDRLFQRLTQLWLGLNLEQSWHLGSADLRITQILMNPHPAQPWANVQSYQQLYEEASEKTRKVTLSFCTPTNFRQGKYDTALPSPESVFNSLLNRWNKYSPIPFDRESLPELFPSFFDINTAIVQDSRSKFIGCVGEISYRMMGKPDPLMVKKINALADFALYAGVGRKTTMGMGMVRRLNDPPPVPLKKGEAREINF